MQNDDKQNKLILNQEAFDDFATDFEGNFVERCKQCVDVSYSEQYDDVQTTQDDTDSSQSLLKFTRKRDVNHKIIQE